MKLQLHSLDVLLYFIPQPRIAPGEADTRNITYVVQLQEEYHHSFKRRMLQ